MPPLGLHLQNYYGSEDGSWMCRWCGVPFSAAINDESVPEEELTTHVCDPPYSSQYRCDWCLSGFPYWMDFCSHIRGATRSSFGDRPICVLDPVSSTTVSALPATARKLKIRVKQQIDNRIQLSDNERLYEFVTNEKESFEINDTTDDGMTEGCVLIATSEDNGRELSDETFPSSRSGNGLRASLEDRTYSSVKVANATSARPTRETSLPTRSSTTLSRRASIRRMGTTGKRYTESLKRVSLAPEGPSIEIESDLFRLIDSGDSTTPTQAPAADASIPPLEADQRPIGGSSSKQAQALNPASSIRTYVTARTSSIATFHTAYSFMKRTLSNASSRSDLLRDLRPDLTSLPLTSVAEDIREQLNFDSEANLLFIARTRDSLGQQLVVTSSRHLQLPENTWNPNEIATIFCRPLLEMSISKVTPMDPFVQMIDTIATSMHTSLVSKLDVNSGSHQKLKSAIARQVLDHAVSLCNLTHAATYIEKRFQKISDVPLGAAAPVAFSTQWMQYLRSRGLLSSPMEELDWSGRGQHVEYGPEDEKDIPLKVEELLGQSATAVVESVMCRRIRLARKKIRVTRKWTKEDIITEVEHLQKVQHTHIIRVVGTYILRRDLSILLYPATPWNLDEFMDELLDPQTIFQKGPDTSSCGSLEQFRGLEALRSFFGCLSKALHAIHKANIKHMDIKPQNILVRPYTGMGLSYKVYIADFGIARSYDSAADSETDSPTAFTKIFAAPEVIRQDIRGFSADIYSLGCVFIEMLATLVSTSTLNHRQHVADLRTNSACDNSFQANIKTILSWYTGVLMATCDPDRRPFIDFKSSLFADMLSHNPQTRPTAAMIDPHFSYLCCNVCHRGPEPFEAANQAYQREA